MQSIKSTAIILTIILASGFGIAASAQEINANADKVNAPSVEQNIKTPQEQTTPEARRCWTRPYC